MPFDCVLSSGYAYGLNLFNRSADAEDSLPRLNCDMCGPMWSVPPRVSGWVLNRIEADLALAQRTHPLPRGGTDLMGPLVVLRASTQGLSLTMTLLLTVPARLILTRKSPAPEICCGSLTATCVTPSLGTLRTDSTSSAETLPCGSSICAVKVERFSPGNPSTFDARRIMRVRLSELRLCSDVREKGSRSN